MGMLIDGLWRADAEFSGDDARRYGAGPFRRRISADGSSGLKAEKGRYHLYVARSCPWCHRAIIFRRLKGLEAVISLSTVEPPRAGQSWSFREPDPLTGARYVHELYQRAQPQFTGRVTVPVLWDREQGTIVSNESADIVRMLDAEFEAFTADRTDHYPESQRARIDAMTSRVHDTVNEGVYRAGFATNQADYERAVRALFDSLDWLEGILSTQRYLLGDQLTEADWRLFPTLLRFDAVYHGLFKCNLRHLYEYPALWAYTRELYQIPGVAEDIDLGECREHYYGAMRHLNPAGIVPLGPQLDFSAPHGRER